MRSSISFRKSIRTTISLRDRWSVFTKRQTPDPVKFLGKIFGRVSKSLSYCSTEIWRTRRDALRSEKRVFTHRISSVLKKKFFFIWLSFGKNRLWGILPQHTNSTIGQIKKKKKKILTLKSVKFFYPVVAASPSVVKKKKVQV